MTAYRAGQVVRAEWPDGSAVEGVCEWRAGNDLVIPVGDIVVGLGALLSKDCAVTILSEPRPEEPTGLGAVVEAATRSGLERRVRFVRGREAPNQWWQFASDDPYACWYAWDDLIDPIVLSEGWTP